MKLRNNGGLSRWEIEGSSGNPLGDPIDLQGHPLDHSWVKHRIGLDRTLQFT